MDLVFDLRPRSLGESATFGGTVWFNMRGERKEQKGSRWCRRAPLSIKSGMDREFTDMIGPITWFVDSPRTTSWVQICEWMWFLIQIETNVCWYVAWARFVLIHSAIGMEHCYREPWGLGSGFALVHKVACQHAWSWRSEAHRASGTAWVWTCVDSL